MFMKTKILYLTGFMGSGKSTVGPILANTLGWDFFDLDRVIEERAGMKIKDMFEKQGEAYFRSLETKVLEELSRKEELVIALGGGTILKEDNIGIIIQSGKTVYLKTSPESVYKRLKYKRDRPILLALGIEENSKEDLIERIRNMMISREKKYLKADLIIDTEKISVGLTVDKIARLINSGRL